MVKALPAGEPMGLLAPGRGRPGRLWLLAAQVMRDQDPLRDARLQARHVGSGDRHFVPETFTIIPLSGSLEHDRLAEVGKSRLDLAIFILHVERYVGEPGSRSGIAGRTAHEHRQHLSMRRPEDL